MKYAKLFSFFILIDVKNEDYFNEFRNYLIFNY